MIKKEDLKLIINKNNAITFEFAKIKNPQNSSFHLTKITAFISFILFSFSFSIVNYSPQIKQV